MSKTIDFSALIAQQPQSSTPSGANIIIADNLPAEALAMVLSMASREAGGYQKNIQKLEGGTDVQQFLDKYFVGYGHQSIADCAPTAIALDKVSMLAAVSFEHHPLFSGQETSTRYVDVTGLDYFLPTEDEKCHELIRECFDMYKKCLEPLVEHMKKKYPYQEDWNRKTYETTVRTKALDVLGSLLPAGARTNMSIVMNLRQLREHLSDSRYHPLGEVCELSETAIQLLSKQYPGAFARMGENAEREEYRRLCMRDDVYYGPQRDASSYIGTEEEPYREWLSHPVLQSRPKGMTLPYSTNRAFTFRGCYTIDFRSFRDLHRHRSINQVMPILTTILGFEEWYLEQMPEEMRTEIKAWLAKYEEKLKTLDLLPADRQYLTPMGYKVFVKFSVGFAHLVYTIELRTQQTVHPTVRKVVQSWAKKFKRLFPEVKLYANMGPDIFDIKRGTQTIVEKEKSQG